MNPLRIAFGLLLVSCATPAVAQEGVDWGGLMAGIAHGTAMDEAARESVSTPTRNRAAKVPAVAAQLSYTPSLERRRANFAKFVAKTRARDPKGAASLEKDLSASDVIARMAPELAKYGLRVDNVADAYAIWWLNAWLASRQRTDTPPARQIAAVRVQAAKAMAAVPGLASASDGEKQELAEANLIQTLLIGASLEQAKGDPAQLGRIATAVRTGARASGLDLDTMDLTDDGFVLRRTSGFRDKLAPVGDKHPADRTGAGGATRYAIAAGAGVGVAALAGGAWLLRARSRQSDRQWG